jgi:hypothetical protein
VKLFQIEEPDGAPVDADAPGAAVGIDLSGSEAAVALAVGGNAAPLADREGFERELTLPAPGASGEAWQMLFEHVRLRAERAIGRPVTHAVIVTVAPEPTPAATLLAASEAAGMTVLRIVPRDELSGAEPPVLTAAVLAEDLAPRPEMP